MVIAAFILGFLCGASLLALRPLLSGGRLRPLGEDEKYLLAAAGAASGRLILRQETAPGGPPLLMLKEYPNPRRMESRDQVQQLLDRKLITPDHSGVPGRYVLTPTGWTRAKRLPEFPLRPVRQGSWFNSISRRPARALRR